MQKKKKIPYWSVLFQVFLEPKSYIAGKDHLEKQGSRDQVESMQKQVSDFMCESYNLQNEKTSLVKGTF